MSDLQKPRAIVAMLLRVLNDVHNAKAINRRGHTVLGIALWGVSLNVLPDQSRMISTPKPAKTRKPRYGRRR